MSLFVTEWIYMALLCIDVSPKRNTESRPIGTIVLVSVKVLCVTWPRIDPGWSSKCVISPDDQ